MAAALKGSQQIGFTIISLTVSLIAALIPLLFMGEIVGRLFHEFAITLAVTIVISAVVSLTLVPMLCARLLTATRRSDRERVGPQRRARLSIGSSHRYGRCAANGCSTCSRSRWASRSSRSRDVAALCHSSPKASFPVQDTGVIQGISEAAKRYRIGAMAERQQALAAAILKDPGRRKPSARSSVSTAPTPRSTAAVS